MSQLLDDPNLYENDDNDSTLPRLRTTARGTFTPSGLQIGGDMTVVSLTTVWKPLPVTPLADRNTLAIQNQSDNDGIVLINYINSGDAGWRIWDGGYREFPITDDIIVYGRMMAGTGSVLVDEEA